MMSTVQCDHCGGFHEFRCPAVSAIEYYNDGTVKRVEYVTQGSFNGADVPWLRKHEQPVTTPTSDGAHWHVLGTPLYPCRTWSTPI